MTFARELRLLKWQYREVRQEGRSALAELWNTVRKKLITLHQAEQNRRRGSRETIHSGKAREQKLGHCRILMSPPVPTFNFNIKEPTQKEELPEEAQHQATAECHTWRPIYSVTGHHQCLHLNTTQAGGNCTGSPWCAVLFQLNCSSWPQICLSNQWKWNVEAL